MAIKAFNVDEQVYKEFLEYCKKEGISMSKKIENFFKSELNRIRPKQSEQKTVPEEHNSFGKYCN